MHGAGWKCRLKGEHSDVFITWVQDLPSVLEQALRVYAALGALLIALVETEWERIFQLFRFAQVWIGRALMQVRS